MKKRYADYNRDKNIIEKNYLKLDTKDDDYFGAVTFLNIKKVANVRSVLRGNEEIVILNNGFRYLNLYPKEENFVIIAIYNEKSELIEFYFDIGKKINYKARVPHYGDLYLDVVLTDKNEVIFLDENELEEAYKLADIKQKDYELARKTADKIVNKFHSDFEFEKLRHMSSDYLDKFVQMEINE